MTDQAMNTATLNKLTHYRRRVELLASERATFIPLWRELSDYHLSNRGRFLVTDRNKGYKRNTKQLNNTSRLAGRTMAAGMMAGITSPARPWFRLGLSDKALMEFGPVKDWLMKVERLMREIYNRSNTYNVLHSTYAELGVFGTAAFGVFEDFDNVIRLKQYTIGSYMLGMNGKDQVDTFAREYQLTVGQLVKEFGEDNVSHDVKNRWDNGDTESWVDVTHLIEPNDNADGMGVFAINKKFRSVYFEGVRSSSGGKTTSTRSVEKFLRESGFNSFPVMGPRWDVTGEDIYGSMCPGLDSLGDTKGLQISEKMKYEAIAKMVKPPLQGPSGLKNKVKTLKPDTILFEDSSSPNQALRPIYEVNFPLQYVINDINALEDRISRTFYEDLFLMLANSDRRQITAREVAERHEEKLLMLGPVLERLHNELLDPLIDRTFNIAMEAGILPPPPTELQGQEIRVEYISVLAQAQRMVASAGVEQLAGFVGGLTNIWPEARHKFNVAQAVDDYGEAIGVSPDLIRTDDEFDEVVAQEAAAMQQQQQQVQAAQAAQTATQMANAPSLDDPNMLSDLVGGKNDG